MAYAVPAGTHANLIAAHNRAHAEAHGGRYAHGDRPAVNLSAAEDVLSGGSPTTLAQAVDVFANGKLIHNRHLPEYSSSAPWIFAHKANDTTNLMAMATLSSGATYEAAHLALLIALASELTTDRELHRTNSGGIWHASIDTATALGTTATMTTFKDVAERLNLLKALDNLHYADVTAHGGTTSAVSAANAAEDSIDSMVTLANDLRSKRNTHLADATAHGGSGGADVTNTIATSAVTGLPSDLATYADSFKTAHNAHLDSTAYHWFRDERNKLGYSTPGTFTAFIAAAAEVYLKQPRHQRQAPVSAAVRI